eukprot:Pgem_evm2s57
MIYRCGEQFKNTTTALEQEYNRQNSQLNYQDCFCFVRFNVSCFPLHSGKSVPPSESDMISSSKKQVVMRLSIAEWQAIIKEFDIQKSYISTSEENDSSSSESSDGSDGSSSEESDEEEEEDEEEDEEEEEESVPSARSTKKRRATRN